MIEGVENGLVHDLEKIVLLGKELDGEIQLLNNPDNEQLVHAVKFESSIYKIRLALLLKNTKMIEELFRDHLGEVPPPKLNEEQQLGSEEPPICLTTSRYRQLRLIPVLLLTLEGNFSRATELLTADTWDDYSKGIIFHNIGNLLFRTKKYHMAYLHYEKALQSMITLPSSNLLRGKQIAKVLVTIALVAMKEFAYFDAFHLFACAILLYPSLITKELILVRMGECCIQVDQAILTERQKNPAIHRFPISIHMLSTKGKQRLLLRFGSQPIDNPPTSFEIAGKTYEALINQMIPIPPESERNSSFVTALLTCSLPNAVVLLQRAYSSLLRKNDDKRIQTMKAALMNMSYAYLKLKDYRLAVHYGNQHILLGGRKSAVVANIIAEGLFHLQRYEECDKVLRAAIQEQTISIDVDATQPFAQHLIVDHQHLISSQHLQCKAVNELEKVALMTNTLTMSLILKENLDLPMVEQLLQQYPRLIPVWKTLFYLHLKRRNYEDINNLVKSYSQKVK